jgi:hypothetical protein
LSLEHGAVAALAEALRAAADWVGCDEVAVDPTVPEVVAGPLRAALAAG